MSLQEGVGRAGTSHPLFMLLQDPKTPKSGERSAQRLQPIMLALRASGLGNAGSRPTRMGGDEVRGACLHLSILLVV